MQAKDHAASTTLPLIPKGKLHRHSNNPQVVTARKRLNDLMHRYSINKSKVFRKRLQEAKNDLEEQNKTLEHDYLTSMIAETEKELAKFPHSPILHYACGSICVVLCSRYQETTKTAHSSIAIALFSVNNDLHA